MSSTKVLIAPYKMLDVIGATPTTYTSQVSDVMSCSLVFIDIRWSGNTGSNTVILQQLRDDNQEWETVNVGTITCTGASGDHQIVISPNPFKKIRLRYTSSAGGETTTALISAKGY